MDSTTQAPDMTLVRETMRAEKGIASARDIVIGTASWRPEGPSANGTLTVNDEAFSLTDFAMRQVCRNVKVPYGFFRDASHSLRQQIATEKFSQLREFRALTVETEGRQTIRGVVDAGYVSVDNSRIVEAMGQLTGWSPVLADGTGILDPVMHIRFMRQDTPVTKGDMFPGVTVIGSELDAADARVEVVLHKVVCSNGLVASYGNGSFYQRKYTGIDPDELLKSINGAWQRGVDELPRFREAIEIAKNKTLSEHEVEAQIRDIQSTRAISKGFGLKVEEGMRSTPVHNMDELVNVMTATARSMRAVQRVGAERFAGQRYGLTFARTKEAN